MTAERSDYQHLDSEQSSATGINVTGWPGREQQAAVVPAAPVSIGSRVTYGGEQWTVVDTRRVHGSQGSEKGPLASTHEEWALRVLPTLMFMARAVRTPLLGPLAPAAERCMGRRCRRPAVLLLTLIDPAMGAHEHPVRLCQRCCNPAIDIFRWLSDCQIEATQFGSNRQVTP